MTGLVTPILRLLWIVNACSPCLGCSPLSCIDIIMYGKGYSAKSLILSLCLPASYWSLPAPPLITVRDRNITQSVQTFCCMEMLRLALSTDCQLGYFADWSDRWRGDETLENYSLSYQSPPDSSSQKSEVRKTNKYGGCWGDPDQARPGWLEKLPAAPVSNESINCTDTA